MDNLHSRVRGLVGEMEQALTGISTFIFQHPELGDQEFEAVRYLTALLGEAGFQVTAPYLGIPTAFRAELKTGPGPTIAFLAEYDALPGYGPGGQPAHACGHNWIAATTVGAGLVLAKMKDAFSGTVVVFGCPAEETNGYKAEMADAGAFDDVDAAFQFHLEEATNLNVTALAMRAVAFTFTGRAAHAAAHPEEGINALDAVQLTFTGINFLRQQLPSDVRIHGIITQGGDAANTIPALGACLFYVRAARKATYQMALEKVENCARGAALMTGAALEISYPENRMDDLLINPVLREVVEKQMLASGIVPMEVDEPPGSSDVGNVSYRCPALYASIGLKNGVVHDEAFVAVADGEEAHRHLLESVECFVCTAVELSRRPDTLRAARRAFQEAVAT